MSGDGVRGPMGRPMKQVDLDAVNTMLNLKMTLQEIAPMRCAGRPLRVRSNVAD